MVQMTRTPFTLKLGHEKFSGEGALALAKRSIWYSMKTNEASWRQGSEMLLFLDGYGEWTHRVAKEPGRDCETTIKELNDYANALSHCGRGLNLAFSASHSENVHCQMDELTDSSIFRSHLNNMLALTGPWHLIDALKSQDMHEITKHARLIGMTISRAKRLLGLVADLNGSSFPEIKALLEAESPNDALERIKHERLRVSAAYLAELNAMVSPMLQWRMLPLLVTIKTASKDMIVVNGARYAKRFNAYSRFVKKILSCEQQKLAHLPEDDPKRKAFNIFEHHFGNSAGGMPAFLPLAARKPDIVAEKSAAGATYLLRFLEIAGRVRESDDPRVLALVFTGGGTAPYLEKLEGRYIA